MTKKSKFIDFVQDSLFSKINVDEIDPDIISYWNALVSKDETEKSMFTDNGKLIMLYLQGLTDATPMKAKDMAYAMGLSSRTISGSMRKLCSDGFVEVLGDSPKFYTLTETGKNIVIED